jgi:hypothetical protein
MLQYVHMQTETHAEQNVSEPMPTGSHPWTDWLTVQDVVTYCLSKGLSRTPKTIRKWAMRSHLLEPGAGDVVCQAQDTENGFRWLIEKNSLDVKIAQELEFEQRRNKASFIPNLLEPVQTGAEESASQNLENSAAEPVDTGANPSAEVQTSAHADIRYISFLEKQLDLAHQQIGVKDRQIDALLERDRETNILIQGLQGGLTRLLQTLPGRKERDGDFRDAA